MSLSRIPNAPFSTPTTPQLLFRHPAHSLQPINAQHSQSRTNSHSFFAGAKSKVKKAASNVVVLDNANFDKYVKDTSKDVLVEFYAPVRIRKENGE